MAPYGGKGLPAALKQINIFGYEPVTTVCQTGEFVVYRAQSPDHRQILLKVPAASRTAAAAIRHLEHELETGRRLDPAFAVKPLRIERDAGNIALLLEDFAARALSGDLNGGFGFGPVLQNRNGNGGGAGGASPPRGGAQGYQA